jgi:hypothetical protein
MATVPIYFKREVAIPPLHQGDHLTVQEFWRRYEATPKKLKAELIEGQVYMASPVSCVEHGAPHFDLITWLGMYRSATPGVKGTDNATVRLNHGANVPQPDASMWIEGGQCRVSDDGYLEGGPDLVGEISAAAQALICTKNLKPLSAIACANTSFGAWRTKPSIGSCSKGADLCPCGRRRTASSRARLFPGYGSMRMP